MATTMMSPLEERLRVEVAAELEKSIKARLEAEYAAQLASMQEAERTRFEDKLARYQKDCERDFDTRVEQEAEKLWRQRRDEFLDRLENLKERLSATEERAVTLEAGLRALATSIWPEEDKYRAVARHMAITELDLGALAPALALLGWRLGAKTTDSQHSVMLLMPPDGAKAVHLLARKRILPAGVGDDTMHEEVRIDAPAHA